MISCFLSPPTTLRIPISFARFTERATVRFIKLMQAISKINKAIPERMYEYIGLLAFLKPFCRSQFRIHVHLSIWLQKICIHACIRPRHIFLVISLKVCLHLSYKIAAFGFQQFAHLHLGSLPQKCLEKN